MWMLVIVGGGLCHFCIGKELCKQRVTLGAEVSVVLVKGVATGDRCLYQRWLWLAICHALSRQTSSN
jgi:hypothetical protein